MSKQSKGKMSVRKRGFLEILGGIAIVAVGGLATAASYGAAKEGETYTVYTGVIAIGIVYTFKGVYDAIFPNGFGKNKKEEADAIEESSKSESSEVIKEED